MLLPMTEQEHFCIGQRMRIRTATIAMLTATTALTGTSCEDAQTKAGTPYEEREIEIEDGRLTPEIIWEMASVGQPSVSSDGKYIAFTIGQTDISEDKTEGSLYIMPTDGSERPRLVLDSKGGSISSPRFTSDGRIAFLRKDKSAQQLHIISTKGTGLKRLTKGRIGVDDYSFSPDGESVMLVRSVDEGIEDGLTSLKKLYPDLPKANARLETDLMYRHWNEWADRKYSHIFIAKFDGEKITHEKDIMEGEPYHAPLRPFGGMEQTAWSPDGKSVAYTCKKLKGIESAKSTNSDIYTYDIATGKTENISSPNGGYDTNPCYAKNGENIYWMSMEHDGYESDRNRIMRKSLKTGETEELTTDSELYIQTYAVSDDDEKIWFIADKDARDEIFTLKTETKEISQLTADTADYTSIQVACDGLIATRTSMYSPTDIYRVDGKTGAAQNITKANEKTLSKLDMGQAEERWIETTDKKRMLTWVVKPPKFNPEQKYPALLYCQGGPQSTVSQFWSKRWNFALMAANGYIVVAPNRRGLPGFGREWNEQISGDYGGQNMRDYLSAIDSLAQEPYVDRERLGCVGASYGGFSAYWLAGHHEHRFKTFIAHCGIFNLDQLYSTTEEIFFTNWDLGGPYWDKTNETAQKSFAQSPHLFVDKWDTPIMVIHGEKDFRIPYTQGMGAFNVARMRGIDAEFLYFPEECHWVTKPQNSILWHREFYRWLAKWLK